MPEELTIADLGKEKSRIGIITVSDRASRGIYEDLSTPELLNLMRFFLLHSPEFHQALIPDEMARVEEEIIRMADELRCHVIFTTGGTGPASRDITPDATRNVCPRVLDGFGERMRAVSLKYVPTAVLSRQIGAIRGQSLVINLPGQPKSIRQILNELFEVIPYTVELISGFHLQENPHNVRVFRPQK